MLDKVEKFIFALVLISVIGATTVVVKTILECMESVAWKKEKELFLKGVKIEL